MDDIECPYCEHGQEICHDDGFGYEEGCLHEIQCSNCDKYFTFTTSIIFSYEAHKADCLNGSNHNYRKTITAPRKYTRMECTDCDESREPTKEEWEEILKN